MSEADFWVSLEYRLCSEFAGMPERRLQYLWCDGFIPSQYLLDDPGPRITGKAWICNGPLQDEWDFALLLPRPARPPEEIDWASLLPPENVTRWMALDEGRRYIEIEPAVAVPDFPVEKRGRRRKGGWNSSIWPGNSCQEGCKHSCPRLQRYGVCHVKGLS